MCWGQRHKRQTRILRKGTDRTPKMQLSISVVSLVLLGAVAAVQSAPTGFVLPNQAEIESAFRSKRNIPYEDTCPAEEVIPLIDAISDVAKAKSDGRGVQIAVLEYFLKKKTGCIWGVIISQPGQETDWEIPALYRGKTTHHAQFCNHVHNDQFYSVFMMDCDQPKPHEPTTTESLQSLELATDAPTGN